jgi:hypothetical protein
VILSPPQEQQAVRTMEIDRRDLRPCCCPSCACERGVFESGAAFGRRPSFYCWAARRRVRRDVEIFIGDDHRRGGQGMTTATEAQNSSSGPPRGNRTVLPSDLTGFF